MRLFTPEEANDALALVRPCVERLVARRRKLLGLNGKLGGLRSTIAGNGGSLDPRRVSKLQESAAAVASELAALVEEIDELGVQLKDLDTGLVDFPAEHPETGETVLLCWQLGESEVAHWHGLEEGFAGRKALPF
jgi:hypothetical protein